VIHAEVNEQSVTIMPPGDTFLSGKVTYFSDSGTKAVPNVTLTLEGDVTYTTTTDNLGNYIFENVIFGNYILKPSKNTDLGGLSAVDVSRIFRAEAGTYTLSCFQMLAADATQNGTIMSTDVHNVGIYNVHYLNGNVSGKCLNDDCVNWSFSDTATLDCTSWPPIVAPAKTRSYTPFSSSTTNQDFVAVRLGDVSGNWPGITRKKRARNPGIDISLSPKISAIRVPMVLSSEERIEGIDISVSFDPSLLTLDDITLNGGILANKYYAIESKPTDSSDIVSFMIYSTDEKMYTGKGTVAYIQFNISEQVSENVHTTLHLTKFDCNEQPANAYLLPPTGTITGKVTLPVAGAVITVPGTDIQAVTDENGLYQLINVPIGQQAIEIVIPGYDEIIQQSVEVQDNQVLEMNIEEQGVKRATDEETPIEEAIRALKEASGM